MSADRIESETLIAAPLERVWELVAQPGFWATDKATLPGTVAVEGETMIGKHPEHGDYPVQVVTVRPPNYLAYRWASVFPGEEIREDNSTLVEFTLAEEDGQTRLRVVESGFSTLVCPEERRASAVEGNTGGWAAELAALKGRAEESSV